MSAQVKDLLDELQSESSERVDFSDLYSHEPVDFSDLLEEEVGEPTRHSPGGLMLANVPGAIQRISHTHLAIMDFMIANPERKLSEVAQEFGYTQPWLSTLIHSDVFQKGFRERRRNWETVHDGRLSSRLMGIAEKALGRMEDLMDGEGESAPSARTVTEVGKLALTSLGFIGGSKQEAAPAVTVNNNFVTAQDIAFAQAIMLKNGGQNDKALLPTAD
jgi:hypothetical protein